VVKIDVYIDGILIPFLFHIFLQVSGVRNDAQKRWHLTPEIGIREGINMGYF
jgi:hypothetical protein